MFARPPFHLSPAAGDEAASPVEHPPGERPLAAGPVACTIVASNYLAFARVFSRSFLEHHPGGRVFVLLVDEPLRDLDLEGEPFEVVEAEELGVPAFGTMAFRYDVLELSTALKPYFLAYLQERRDVERLCYFDPDVLVLGDLAPLYDRLGAADLLLTPHLTEPLEDRCWPGERDILVCGVYNLGFVGVSRGVASARLLDWWQRRLRWDCRHRVDQGLFVDQRWMDLAPALVDRVAIVRDPGMNVAYWNLAHRRIERCGEQWRVNGEPLRFFHFSGYDPDRPAVVSKFQNRIRFDDRPELRPLFDRYRDLLLAAGHERLRGIPYSRAAFDDGRPVPALARDLYAEVDPEGERWPDPFRCGGSDDFAAWLLAPASGGEPTIPRLALHLWWRRGDLRQAFPSPLERDRQAFAAWLTAASSRDLGFDPGLLARTAQASPVGPARGDVRGARLPRIQPSAESVVLAADLDGGRRPFLPRFALEIHAQRRDVRFAFPFPLARDRDAFAYWLVTAGRWEYRMPRRWLAATLATLPWRRRAGAELRYWRLSRGRGGPPPEATAAAVPGLAGSEIAPPRRRLRVANGVEPGVNVVGWARAATGVGEACRGTLDALARAGLPCSLYVLDGDGPAAASARQGLPHEVTLWQVNADMLDTVRSHVPLSLRSGRREVATWFWELAHFPDRYAGAFEGLSELWAPSRFCAAAFAALSPVEVVWMPPSVPRRRSAPMARGELGVPQDAFLFFNAFDVASRHERKNPLGLLEAFGLAVLASRRPIHLLLHVNRAEADPHLVAELRRRSRGLPVTLSTSVAGREEIDRFFATSDAFVSLHRSEGLGLPLIESTYFGKPVLATGYGGVSDFLTPETGWVVPHRLVALEQDIGPYPRGAVWADPDLDRAAEAMCELASSPLELRQRRVERALRRVLELYDPGVVGARIRRQLGFDGAVQPAATGAAAVSESVASANL